MFAAWLGLIALHALGTRGGSGRVSSAFTDVAGLIERVLDADVPAIPDRRAGAAPAAPAPAEPAEPADEDGGPPPRLPVPTPPK